MSERDVIIAADALSKALKAWVLSGLRPEDWPSVQEFGVAYEKARAGVDLGEPHVHRWVDMRNEIVRSGEMCIECRAIRAGNTVSTDQAG